MEVKAKYKIGQVVKTTAFDGFGEILGIMVFQNDYSYSIKAEGKTMLHTEETILQAYDKVTEPKKRVRKTKAQLAQIAMSKIPSIEDPLKEI